MSLEPKVLRSSLITRAPSHPRFPMLSRLQPPFKRMHGPREALGRAKIILPVLVAWVSGGYLLQLQMKD